MARLLDPDRSFQYVKAADTDIRKTFERARKEIKERQERESSKDDPRNPAAANLSLIRTKP